MRQEEVCGLDWSQVSIQRREVRLTKTKTSSPRVVPLSDAATATLIGAPRHITSPYVFWHDDGRRYACFANSFALVARRAGVPFRCHDLRHAFAQPVPPGHGQHPSPSSNPWPQDHRHDDALRPHGHRPLASSNGRFGTITGTIGTVSGDTKATETP